MLILKWVLVYCASNVKDLHAYCTKYFVKVYFNCILSVLL